MLAGLRPARPAGPPPQLSPVLPLVEAHADARPGAPKPAVGQGGPGGDLRSRQLQPGRRVLVCYADDPGYWHERLLLCPSWEKTWYVMTGDGDIYPESPKDWQSAYDITGARVFPAGLRGGMVQFA